MSDLNAKMHKIQLPLWLSPDPAGGAYSADLSLCCLSPIQISHNFQSFSVHVMSLNTKYLVVKRVLSRLKCTKIDFGRGSVQDPTGGAYDAPQTPSRLVRGKPPPHSFGIPISSPGEADLRVGSPSVPQVILTYYGIALLCNHLQCC